MTRDDADAIVKEVAVKAFQLMAEARPIREGLFGFNHGDLREFHEALVIVGVKPTRIPLT